VCSGNGLHGRIGNTGRRQHRGRHPGTLEGASPAERAEGIAFWIATPSSGRIGYGPLASYNPGIVAGATVTIGEPLGLSGGALAIALERGPVAINPWPLLTAVRPSN
jgi:hypothetical protein